MYPQDDPVPVAFQLWDCLGHDVTGGCLHDVLAQLAAVSLHRHPACRPHRGVRVPSVEQDVDLVRMIAVRHQTGVVIRDLPPAWQLSIEHGALHLERHLTDREHLSGVLDRRDSHALQTVEHSRALLPRLASFLATPELHDCRGRCSPVKDELLDLGVHQRGVLVEVSPGVDPAPKTQAELCRLPDLLAVWVMLAAVLGVPLKRATGYPASGCEVDVVSTVERIQPPLLAR